MKKGSNNGNYGDIRNMFIAGMQSKGKIPPKTNEKSMNTSITRKRKADEVFSDEDNFSKKKKIVEKSPKKGKKQPIVNKIETTKSSKSNQKKKKIIEDEDDEDYSIDKMDIDDEISDEEEFSDEESEKPKKNKKLKKSNKKTKSRSKSKSPVRPNTRFPVMAKAKRGTKRKDSMDLDEEKIDLIEQQFQELEAEEKTIKTRQNSKTKNNILTEQLLAKSNKKNQSQSPMPKKNDKAEKNTTQKKKQAVMVNKDMIGILDGLTFVITGIFSIERDRLSDLLKGYGAKVTNKVSKKTSYLLYGNGLEDGREVTQGSKYREADKLGVAKMNEEELETFIGEKVNDPDFKLGADHGSGGAINLGKIEAETAGKTNNSMLVDRDTNKNVLWTTKHSPVDITEIVGNQKAINSFITWLDDWEDVVLYGNKKPTSFKGKGKIDNPNARACLISGDPGIGKTTVVRLIAKMKGYKTFELNASDQRNKSIIASKLGYLLDNTTLQAGEIKGKNMIVMDEVDGMGGNEDRGGMAALIDVIKKTKVPIVCIANDRNSQKLRSLINYCYDIKFSKPDKRQIVNRLLQICQKENFPVEPNALENLIESVGNDIRQCLNFLEMWARNNTCLKYNQMVTSYQKFNKDSLLMISNFDAAAKILNKQQMKKLNFREKMNLFFIDYDLIPLLIHENYLNCYNKTNDNDLNSLVKSTEHISLGDTLDKKIRSQQDWNLLQNMGIHSCLAVSQFSGNSIPFPKFPELMGKMQRIRKVKRELRELKYSFPGISTKSIKEEIVPLVLSKIANNLVDYGKDGIDMCLKFMEEYKLSMDKFKEHVMDLQPSEKLLAKFNNVSQPLRTALTRRYNETFKTSLTKRKRKDGADTSKVRYDDEGNVIEEMDGEEDEEDEEEPVEIKTKKGKKKK